MVDNWRKADRLRLVRFLWLLCQLITPAIGHAQKGRLVYETVHSLVLAKNLLGDSPERSVNVYLPPSYGSRTVFRYPVIYLLHGYTASNKQWTADGHVDIGKMMDDLIGAGRVHEMIVVMPDGKNKYAGSFYTNSVTTGNWEDFLTRELKHIDAKFRTIPRSSSRGIAGWSMGGYGAIKLGMKHPDIYSTLYGLSACCLGWGSDLSLDNPAWDATLAFKTMDDLKKADFYPLVFMALSAAWSPNRERPPFFVDLPVERQNGTRKPKAETQAKWSANMPVAMVDQFRSNLTRLRGIAFDVGTQDEFPHIPAGARTFSAALKRNGIQHVFEEYEGDHSNKIGNRIETKLLPFFSGLLEFKTR